MQKDKEEIENKIDYWKKHQELDKFNHQESLSTFVSFIAIIFSVIIGIVSIILNIIENPWISSEIIFVITCIFIIFILLFQNSFKSKINGHNLAFRIREAMLRVWYNQLHVNTDLLDSQFENIKKDCEEKMSNKEIENVAKRIIEE